MAERVPKKFKAQLITTDRENGKQIKRNFSNVRYDIADADLQTVAKGIYNVLPAGQEDLASVNLTANSALDLK